MEVIWNDSFLSHIKRKVPIYKLNIFQTHKKYFAAAKSHGPDDSNEENYGRQGEEAGAGLHLQQIRLQSKW